MKVCIMCGGEGTRLRPLTFERPKPCIPIVNRPSIEHLVTHLSNMGFRDVVITLGYMGTAIEEALGDGSLFGTTITYVKEKSKLGTAGSVKNAQKYLDGADFLVVGGDHVTDLNVLEFYRAHRKEKAAVSIGLLSIDDPGEYGIAEIDVSYTIKRFKEKPAPGEIFSNLASTGMYVCNPMVFDYIPSGRKFDFARDLFPQLMEEGKPLKGWLARGNWTDVGSPRSLRQAERWMLAGMASTTIIGDLSMRGSHIKGPVELGDSVTLGRNSRIIGPVAIGAGSMIGANVLGNARLQTVVRDAIGSIREGESIAVPLKRSGQFPPMVTHMIAIGERTGQLEQMLENVARSYEADVDTRVVALTSLLEPVMIVLLGGVVGFIALAILMPLIQMNSLVQ